MYNELPQKQNGTFYSHKHYEGKSHDLLTVQDRNTLNVIADEGYFRAFEENFAYNTNPNQRNPGTCGDDVHVEKDLPVSPGLPDDGEYNLPYPYDTLKNSFFPPVANPCVVSSNTNVVPARELYEFGDSHFPPCQHPLGPVPPILCSDSFPKQNFPDYVKTNTSGSNSIGIVITTDASTPNKYMDNKPSQIILSSPFFQNPCILSKPTIPASFKDAEDLPPDYTSSCGIIEKPGKPRRYRTELKLDLRKYQKQKTPRVESRDFEETDVPPVKAILCRAAPSLSSAGFDKCVEMDSLCTQSQPSPGSEYQPCPTTSSEKNVPSHSIETTEQDRAAKLKLYRSSGVGSDPPVMRNHHLPTFYTEPMEHTIHSNLSKIQHAQETPSTIYGTLTGQSGSLNLSSGAGVDMNWVLARGEKSNHATMATHPLHTNHHDRRDHMQNDVYYHAHHRSDRTSSSGAGRRSTQPMGDQLSTVTLVSPRTRKTSRGTQFEEIKQVKVVRDMLIQVVPVEDRETQTNAQDFCEVRPDRNAIMEIDTAESTRYLVNPSVSSAILVRPDNILPKLKLNTGHQGHQFDVSSADSSAHNLTSPSTFFVLAPGSPAIHPEHMTDLASPEAATKDQVLIGLSKTSVPSVTDTRSHVQPRHWDDTTYSRTVYHVIQRSVAAGKDQPCENRVDVQAYSSTVESSKTMQNPLKRNGDLIATGGNNTVWRNGNRLLRDRSFSDKEENTFSLGPSEEVVLVEQTNTPNISPKKLHQTANRASPAILNPKTVRPVKNDSCYVTDQGTLEICTCCQYTSCASRVTRCSTCSQMCDCESCRTSVAHPSEPKPRGHTIGERQVGAAEREACACFEREHICALCNVSCVKGKHVTEEQYSCSSCCRSQTVAASETSQQHPACLKPPEVFRPPVIDLDSTNNVYSPKKRCTNPQGDSELQNKIQVPNCSDPKVPKENGVEASQPIANPQPTAQQCDTGKDQFTPGLEALIQLAMNKDKRSIFQRWLSEQLAYSTKKNSFNRNPAPNPKCEDSKMSEATTSDQAATQNESECSCSRCCVSESTRSTISTSNNSADQPTKSNLENEPKEEIKLPTRVGDNPEGFGKYRSENNARASRKATKNPSEARANSEQLRPASPKPKESPVRATTRQRRFSQSLDKPNPPIRPDSQSTNRQSGKSSPQRFPAGDGGPNARRGMMTTEQARKGTITKRDLPPRAAPAGSTLKRSSLMSSRLSTNLNPSVDTCLDVERVFELSQHDDLVKSYQNHADRRIKSVGLKNGCEIRIVGPIVENDSQGTKQTPAIWDKVTYQCRISAPTEDRIWKCVNFLKDTFPNTFLRSSWKA